jgi:WD40 repeat protein
MSNVYIQHVSYFNSSLLGEVTAAALYVQDDSEFKCIGRPVTLLSQPDDTDTESDADGCKSIWCQNRVCTYGRNGRILIWDALSGCLLLRGVHPNSCYIADIALAAAVRPGRAPGVSSENKHSTWHRSFATVYVSDADSDGRASILNLRDDIIGSDAESGPESLSAAVDPPATIVHQFSVSDDRRVDDPRDDGQNYGVSIGVSADASVIAVGYHHRYALTRVWDGQTMEHVSTIQAQRESIDSICVQSNAADEHIVATVSRRDFSLWNAKDGTCVGGKCIGGPPLSAICLNRRCDIVATGDHDGQIIVYDFISHQCTQRTSFTISDCSIMTMQFASSDYLYVLTKTRKYPHSVELHRVALTTPSQAFALIIHHLADRTASHNLTTNPLFDIRAFKQVLDYI